MVSKIPTLIRPNATDKEIARSLTIAIATNAEIELAKRIATAAIEKYGDWQDQALYDRMRSQGIWMDSPSVQAALSALYIMRLRHDAT